MEKCKTCMYWDQYQTHEGKCTNVHEYDESGEESMFALSDPGGFFTHPEFGCNQHKECEEITVSQFIAWLENFSLGSKVKWSGGFEVYDRNKKYTRRIDSPLLTIEDRDGDA